MNTNFYKINKDAKRVIDYLYDVFGEREFREEDLDRKAILDNLFMSEIAFYEIVDLLLKNNAVEIKEYTFNKKHEGGIFKTTEKTYKILL